ncbi:MAG: hypothetical protein K0S12_936 [Bacteroidetes bacterium]|jgi:hypothetical protein|nr:hypothetical protein [Bacteroidota bacterium]
MKTTLCISVIVVLMSCKRYTCECSTTTQQTNSENAYIITAQDKQEAQSKCEYKNSKNSIGTKKSYCVIK